MKVKLWEAIDLILRTLAIVVGALFMLLSVVDPGTVGMKEGMADFLFGSVLILFGLSHDPSKFHTTVYIEKKSQMAKEDAEDLAEMVSDK